MPRIELFTGKKGKTYNFFDRHIKNIIFAGGTEIIIHKYLGIFDQGETNDITLPATPGSTKKVRERGIQDLTYLENRDREYDNEHEYVIKGTYQIQDVDGQVLNMPGIFYENDTLFFIFHINDMIERLGRRIIPGDVLELSHIRDDAMLDDDAAINKYYEVTDVSLSAEGFSPQWWSHLWRCKAKMAKNSQELSDIMNREPENAPGRTLADIASVFPEIMPINQANIDQANIDVPEWNFQNLQMYVVPGDETTHWNPYLWTGTGSPPNGHKLDYSGSSFPKNVPNGTWFLNTAMEPPVLYQKTEPHRWTRMAVDYRRSFDRGARLVKSFVNNRNSNVFQDGERLAERQYANKLLKPRADL